MSLRLTFICLTLLMTACTSMEPLTIPAADRVTSIETSFLGSYDRVTNQYKRSTTLTDPTRIATVITVLNENNAEMHKPLDTFPTPTHTIVVTDKDNLNLVVFIGKNWLGGRNNIAGDGGMNRLRTISDEQRTLLLHTIGIGD